MNMETNSWTALYETYPLDCMINIIGRIMERGRANDKTERIAAAYAVLASKREAAGITNNVRYS